MTINSTCFRINWSGYADSYRVWRVSVRPSFSKA